MLNHLSDSLILTPLPPKQTTMRTTAAVKSVQGDERFLHHEQEEFHSISTLKLKSHISNIDLILHDRYE